MAAADSFNTQPPEGGWGFKVRIQSSIQLVSTHSRLKAAGLGATLGAVGSKVSTHSRLKAAGGRLD